MSPERYNVPIPAYVTLGLLCVLALRVLTLHAQEKPARETRQEALYQSAWQLVEQPARETRQWHVAMLPKDSQYQPVRIDVIDTDGVCLYVVRSWNMNAPAVTAVPKTALPKGTGCQ